MAPSGFHRLLKIPGVAAAAAALLLCGCDRAPVETAPTEASPESRASDSLNRTTSEDPEASPSPQENKPLIVTTLPPGGPYEDYPGGVTPHFIHDETPSDEEIKALQEIENRQAQMEGREAFDLRAYYDEVARLRTLYPLEETWKKTTKPEGGLDECGPEDGR
jgi:hypothetical protein